MSAMTSLARTLERLDARRTATVLQEVRHGEITASLSGGELLNRIAGARAFVRGLGLASGDRVVVIAQNSANWIALALALRAEGLVSVPLQPQRSIDELTTIVAQSEPGLVCGDDPTLIAELASRAKNLRVAMIDETTHRCSGRPSGRPSDGLKPVACNETDDARSERFIDLATDDLAAIIYTSGTSGAPKGAMLTCGGVEHVIACANARLESLAIRERPERVFHYLPFCFAGSWILMLTCLSRDTVLSVSLDPKTSLIDDLAASQPHYLLNVPLVLERIRTRVDAQIASRPRLERWALGQPLLRPVLRAQIRKRFGPNLRGLICGSAPLARETQRWFQALGIPVYQVYGLTETTAVCTIDRENPAEVVAGRVGYAIDGVELRRDESGEILARGPNVFAGYWRNPQATARVLADGWLRTGDHGEVDANGNWAIGGRVDTLIVRPSGHKVAPERLEELLASHLPSAQHVVIVDGGANGLTAIVTGAVTEEQLAAALGSVNARVAPHEAIRGSRIHGEPFTLENAMLTANGKIKRDRVAAWCRGEPERAAVGATA